MTPSRPGLGADYDRRPTAEEIDWQLRGLCRGKDYDPQLWTPNPPNVERQQKEAAKLCKRHCPVIQQCRDWALEHHELYGVWGGMTESERDEVWNGGRKRKRRECKVTTDFYADSA